MAEIRRLTGWERAPAYRSTVGPLMGMGVLELGDGGDLLQGLGRSYGAAVLNGGVTVWMIRPGHVARTISKAASDQTSGVARVPRSLAIIARWPQSEVVARLDR